MRSPVFQSVNVHLLLLTALLRRLLVADFPPDSLQRALFCLSNRNHSNHQNNINNNYWRKRQRVVMKWDWSWSHSSRRLRGVFLSGTFVRGMSVGIVAPSLDNSLFSSSVSTISLNWNCGDKQKLIRTHVCNLGRCDMAFETGAEPTCSGLLSTAESCSRSSMAKVHGSAVGSSSSASLTKSSNTPRQTFQIGSNQKDCPLTAPFLKPAAELRTIRLHLSPLPRSMKTSLSGFSALTL